MRGTASLTVERAHARGVIAAFICMFGAGLARAQDMEPRSFSASPIDTNFLIGSYQRTTGDVALDADLPISDVKATINTGVLAYNRTFDLFGHTGSVAIVLPYFQGNLSGNVGSESRQITREGFGDFAFRLTENLIGSPALTPAEFARRADNYARCGCRGRSTNRRIQFAATHQHQFPSLGVQARDRRVAADRKLVRGGFRGHVDFHR